MHRDIQGTPIRFNAHVLVADTSLLHRGVVDNILGAGIVLKLDTGGMMTVADTAKRVIVLAAIVKQYTED